MMRQTILSTPRLILTTWEEGDLTEFQALHSDPVTMRYFASGPYDEARATERLAAFRRDQAEWGWTKWRAQDAGGRVVGRGGFGLYAGTHRELGYLLLPELWGQGLATELAQTLVEWHFAHPDPRLSGDLLGFAHTENRASRRVLEKVGFTPTHEGNWQGQPHAFYRLPAD